MEQLIDYKYENDCLKQELKKITEERNMLRRIIANISEESCKIIELLKQK